MDKEEATPKHLPADIAVVVPAYNVGDRLDAVLDGLLSIVSAVIVVAPARRGGGPEGANDVRGDRLTCGRTEGKGTAVVGG